MPKDTTTPPGPSGEGQRRPVIIDLPAAEVGRKSGTGDPDPGGAPGAAPAEAVSETTVPPAGDARSTRRGSDTADPWATAATSGAAAPAQAAEPVRRRRGASFPALLLAALLGGAIGAGALVAAERTGYLDRVSNQAGIPGLTPPEDGIGQGAELAALKAQVAELASLRTEIEALRQAPQPTPPDIQPLAEQIAALEQAIAELRNRPAAEAPESGALREVQNRLAELEKLAAVPGSEEIPPALEARLTDLSGQVEAMRASGASGAADPALSAVAGRIDEIASRLGSLETRPGPDVSGLESRIAGLDQALAGLNGRIDGLAADDGALPALEGRVAELAGTVESLPQLEQRLADLAGRVDTLPNPDRVAAVEASVDAAAKQAARADALGPAVAADALAAALASGAPFRAELDALRAFGVEEPALAGLEPHADAGLPTMAELQASFASAAAGLELAGPVPAGTGIADRLLQSARGLVEVRPLAPAQGEDPASVLARMRAAVGAGDLRLALTEWNSLPEAAKTRLGGWAGEAEARLAAEDAAARLRADALARLGTQG